MKKIVLLLMTVLCSLGVSAQTESAFYNLPEGAFVSGMTSTAALSTPQIYAPYSKSGLKFTSVTGDGDWYTNGTKRNTSGVTGSTTINVAFASQYYIPELKIEGLKDYSYGCGSSSNKYVYSGYGTMVYMTPAKIWCDLIQASSGQAQSMLANYKTATNDVMGVFFDNKDVMYVDGISIPVTSNTSGQTVDDLFPNEGSHIIVNIYPATITKNAGKYTNVADRTKPIWTGTLTKANFVKNASNAYRGGVNVTFDSPISIEGAFCVELSDMKNSGCAFYIYSAKERSGCNYFGYYLKDGKETYPNPYTLAVSVHAMFPAIAKADASVETLTFMGAGGDVNATINSNVDPKDVDITMPGWITKKEIIYETGTFSASKANTIVFSATENTTGEKRTGTITINNRGKEISYNVEQGSASNDVAVESVTLDSSTRELESGYKATLQATVLPEDATDKSLVWTSSDEGIVTIDADGTIHYKGDGKATITATSNSNPDVKATCEVTTFHYEDCAPFGTATGSWNLVAKKKVLLNLPVKKATNNVNRFKVSKFNYSTGSQAKDVVINVDEDNKCTISQMSTGYSSNSKTIYMATSADGTYNPATATFTLPMKYYTTEKTLYEKTETFQLDAAITVSDAGYATTYLPFPVSIPEGVSVFAATINESTKQVTMNELDEEALPAEMPVVIKAEPDTYVFNAAFDVADLNVASDLKGTLVEATATDLGETVGSYVYVLNKVEDELGFYHLGEEGSLAANRAYLLVDASLIDAAAAKSLKMMFDEPTGITDVNTTKTSGSRYNISGQAVGAGFKGIVIVNGKKYVE